MLQTIDDSNNKTRVNRLSSTFASKFFLISEINFTVPSNYNHYHQLDSINKNEFSYFDNDIADENYKNINSILTSDQEFIIKIFGIDKRVTRIECIEFLKTKEAVLVGAHGASLIFQNCREIYPSNRYTVSFDEDHNSYIDQNGDILTSYIDHTVYDGREIWSFLTGKFKEGLSFNHCLLCFIPKHTS